MGLRRFKDVVVNDPRAFRSPLDEFEWSARLHRQHLAKLGWFQTHTRAEPDAPQKTLDLLHIIKRVHLSSHFMVPWMIEAVAKGRFSSTYYDGGVDGIFRVQVPHRDTGELIPLDSPFSVTPDFVRGVDPEHATQMVQQMLFGTMVSLLRHELDENFFFDGKRVCDPHANDPKAGDP
jgi:hypothetical protein